MRITALFTFFALLFSSVAIAQESLIADIMNVAPVTVKADETTVEANEDYQEEFADQKQKVDDLFSKHSEKFAGEVKDLIERYNKVLAKAIEQDVKNEKQKVATRVNALSMGLVRSKKEVLVQFNNNLISSIRELPKSLKEEKEEELKTQTDEYAEAIDTEFQANQQVLKAFKEAEHLTTEMDGGEE